MFLSKSGADFLESSNAKRLDKNRLKLSEIEDSLLNPNCLWRYEKEQEIETLKNAILRAEIWLEKSKSLEK